MTGALAQITVREWRKHKLRLVLTVVGIALGVAVFFSVRTANRTLVSSLYATIEKLAGRATLQIVSGETGFPLEIVDRVRSTPGVSLAEPVTETVASMPNGEKLIILGLDTSSDLAIYQGSFDQGNLSVKNPLAFASREDSLAVTRAFADRFGLKEGDPLTVNVQSGPMQLTVRGLFRSEGIGEVFDGNVAVMDLAAAQAAFGRGARIDRIDIATETNASQEEIQQMLTAWLPQGIKVVRPELRGQAIENTVASMHYGLTIMSLLALLIGLFIIFNSFTISLNQRWKELGILRALGVERGNVQRMFLVEAAVLGLVGSAIGVGGGYFLAKMSLGFVNGTMASFYGFASTTSEIEFNPVYAVQAFVAGAVASVVAAWLPSRAASHLNPALALHNIESRQREAIIGWPRLLAGIGFVAAGVALTRFASPVVGVNFQLFYAFIMLVGMILLVPKITELGARIIRPLMNRLFGPTGLIAVETMARSPRRTSSTVIALMMGLGFAYSHVSFIESQKVAMRRVLDKAVSADVLVTSSNEVHSKTYHFSEATAERIGSLPEIAVYDLLRIAESEYEGVPVAILSHDVEKWFEIAPDLLDEGDLDSARVATARGEGILVSTNFVARFNRNVGDTVTLNAPNGPVTLPIVGTLDYYRSEKGTIFFDRSLFKKYWNDSDADYVLLDLKPGADRAAVKAKIEELLAGQNRAFIYTHEEYKAWVDTVLDQFFALMYVQMVISMCVAIVGLVNTMIISVAERRRELGIFRAIGGLRGQVAKMVVLEAVAISLIGLFVGTITGVLNAYFLVNTAARVVAGFTLPLVFPALMVLVSIPLVIAIAIVSAWFPARNAARLNVVEAIGYE